MTTKRSGKIAASRLTMHIGFWMRLVSNHVSYAFARKLESSGVTVAEWVILREMYGGDDTTSPSVVAELTGLTRGAVSKLISRLLEKSLVTRRNLAAIAAIKTSSSHPRQSRWSPSWPRLPTQMTRSSSVFFPDPIARY